MVEAVKLNEGSTISLWKENEKLKKSWEEYVSTIEKELFFFRSSGFHPHQYKGDINLYRLFLERFFWLLELSTSQQFLALPP